MADIKLMLKVLLPLMNIMGAVLGIMTFNQLAQDLQPQIASQHLNKDLICIK
jgi:glucose-6-phosphate isomerase